MSQNTPPNPMTTMRVVYDMPGTADVSVRQHVAFPGADGGGLAMDVYRPAGTPTGARVPAVVIVSGYPDAGFERMLGCRFKDMESSRSWGRLLAASGMTAITYTNREPVADLQALMAHLRQHAAVLCIDEARLGVWASSGNVPLALSLLMDASSGVSCAAFCYGYMLDLEGATGVADAAAQFRFANPCAGKSVADLPAGRPILLAKAGQDQMPGLNASIDQFIAAARAANGPVTLATHPTGPHAFDLVDDSDASRDVIRQVLAFLRAHLVK